MAPAADLGSKTFRSASESSSTRTASAPMTARTEATTLGGAPGMQLAFVG